LYLKYSWINLKFIACIESLRLKPIVLYVGFLFVLLTRAQAQVGGKSSFHLFNLPGNAHQAALGGTNISTFDRDINMVWQNPALLRDTMKEQLSVSYIPFYAAIKGGSVSYAHKFKKVGTLAMGIQYVNFGSMTERDETGAELNTFTPQDIALQVAKSHNIGLFTLGSTFKYVYSTLAPTYNSHAVMLDVAGIFRHPTRDFTIGMAFKNVGFAIKNYSEGASAKAPMDIQLGTSYKLEHIPVRLSLTAHHLYKFDIVYQDTSFNKKYDLNGDEIVQKKSFGDKVLRHFVISTEVLLSKNLHARLAYNFQRRREMRLEDRAGTSGFSWGFLIRIKSFQLDYARSYYHLSGGKNWLTLTVDMNRLIGKN
jgi:hypothetical protein